LHSAFTEYNSPQSAGVHYLSGEVLLICHCHPIISCFVKIQIGLTVLVPAYPGCPKKEAVKRVSVFSGPAVRSVSGVCVFAISHDNFQTK